MAKVKGLFGTNIRGSIGGVTFRKRGSKNIASQKVSGAKKSATPAQIYQRAVGNTTMQAYSVMKTICDHSFEGVQMGALSMSHFLKVNNNLLRGLGNSAGFIAKGRTKKAAPNPYIISEGSLPQIFLHDVIPDDGSDFKVSLWALSESVRTKEEWLKVTPRSLMSSLGLEPSDQLSIVANIDIIGDDYYPDSEVTSASPMYCALTRYLFDDAKWDTPLFKAAPSGVPKLANALVVDESVLDKTRSTLGDVRLVVAMVDTKYYLAVISLPTDRAMMTVGVIASRKGSSGTWLRSTCQMSVDATANILTAYAYQEVYPSYEYAEEERILNYVEPLEKSTE